MCKINEVLRSLSVLFCFSAPLQAQSPSTEKCKEFPTPHHENIKSITLFAQNPDILTPVGIALAPNGRVFVQENNTHKRTASYKGPKTDRILVFEDSDNDGTADKRSVFYEGQESSTDLLMGPDGHLYVCTRNFIGRFKDAANKEKADGEPEVLIKCETTGDYPHNGIGGLAIDPAFPDVLAFGFGENLGHPYKFIGTDGSSLSGGGEGGSTYKCKTDGSKLERLSTGHWNAFGMTFDLQGNLFSTDNDPNSTPPNRLLHIIPGADFGFEYRYGRSGRHPLVDWFGEKPGTLGRVGALGEAACGIISFGKGQLLSASWTDNRVDIHQIKKNGTSFTATREKFISGNDDFRPVHFSYSADGKYLYFTDWVKLSYPVHGYGRVWRVEFKEPVSLKPLARENPVELTAQQALENLASEDPYLRTAAMYFLSKNPQVLAGFKWQEEENAVRRAHFAIALKRNDAVKNAAIIPELLKDSSADVRYVAAKWIADEKLTQYKNLLNDALQNKDIKSPELLFLVAAISALEGKSANNFSADSIMMKLAEDKTRPQSLRASALKNIPGSFRQLSLKKLEEFISLKSAAITEEAVKSLVIHPDSNRFKLIAEVAEDSKIPPQTRADAIAGLSGQAKVYKELLERLSKDENESIKNEAFRALGIAGLASRKMENKPGLKDFDAWLKMLDSVPGKADTGAGRRVFFNSSIARCFTCHSINGRGTAVGPDLSDLHKQEGMNRKWLIEHILDPNIELAPYFRPQQISTKDGKVQIGLNFGNEGSVQKYMNSSGESFSVKKADITDRSEINVSLMPPGLLYLLTASETRDLLAFILKGSE